MQENKFYAVKKGRKTGIFSSWKKCENSISGYSGAEYKSFNDLESAKQYLNDNDHSYKNIEQLNSNEMIAYVDGSYDENIDYYSYGAICFYENKKESFSDRGRKKELLDMRNVGGEIKAAQLAMNVAIKNGIDKLYLYYDYEGIKKWCTAEWKTNKKATQKYKKYYDSISNDINIEFVKVKAHSGEKYNEEVDSLAKDALYNESSSDTFKEELKSCKIWGNNIIPVFNILDFDDEVFNTDDFFKKFKSKWKAEGKKLKDIEDLQILIDINKRELKCLVEVDEVVEEITIRF